MSTATQRQVHPPDLTKPLDSTKFTGALALFVMTLLYAPWVMSTASRALWHDELFTYYMSKYSSLEGLIHEIRNIDLNPPFLYMATRASFSIFGDSEFATRLPSFVAFWAASACLLVFVMRRLNAWYGLLAVVVFWFSNALILATEARPYALLLMFLGIALVCWQEAALRSPYRKLALAVLPLGLVGMIATHCLSPFYFLPFACAEGARLWETKKADLLLWGEFVLCAMTVKFYAPLMNRLGGTKFATAFRPSFRSLLHFWKEIVFAVGPALLVASLVVFCFVAWRKHSERSSVVKPTYAEFGLVLGLLLIPVTIDLALMRNNAPFWPRYAVGAAMGVGIGFAWLVALYTSQVKTPALLATFAVVLVSVLYGNLSTSTSSASTVDLASLENIRPELPLIAASGLVFLEIDHYGTNRLDSRLYYLTDPVASDHYAHANLFEGMSYLKQFFPIRAKVSPYSQFVAEHPRFVVFGVVGYPEDWLMPKLEDDGASFQEITHYPGPWGREITVFEVNTRRQL